MDRQPKAAPFAVGTRLRYTGTDASWHEIEGERVYIYGPGVEVTVAETRPGRRGTLRQLRDEDGPMEYEDTGEPILDTTRDGYSITVCARSGYRMIINPDRWAVVEAAPCC